MSTKGPSLLGPIPFFGKVLYHEISMILSFFRWIGIVVWTLFLSVIAILASLFDTRGRIHDFLSWVWARGFLLVVGVRVTVEGKERLSGVQIPLILMSSHRSHVDIPVILSFLPLGVRFIAKKELLWIPIFGWALARAGHIFIDRQDRTQATESLRRAAQHVRQGRNVLVFPEGTRGGGTTLLPFKKGGFVLAIESQVPILPMAVIGTDRVLPKKGFRITPGPVRVVIGDSIPTAGYGYADRDRLMERVRKVIENEMKIDNNRVA